MTDMFRQFCFLMMLGCFLLIGSTACRKQQVEPPATTIDTSYYFPPLNGNTWERINAADLNWDTTKLRLALEWAASKQSFGMVILYKGKIVAEQYTGTWDVNTRYTWFSAGKSAAAFIAGMAQQEGLLDIQKPASDYLGAGWTSLTREQEQRIKVWHQLTMTTGLDETVPDLDCTTPSCLQYKAEPGTKWYYHNAPYLLLHTVIANGTRQTMQAYSKSRLFDRIGMSSALWYGTYLLSTTREAARFGSLVLNRGVWNRDTLMKDRNYFQNMVSTSQSMNPAYGYLWWLNGKQSFMVPTLTQSFNGSLVPTAPADMIMALGKDDKKIYVVPSQSLVVVRLGDAAGSSLFGPSGFDNEWWGRMREVTRSW
jgi:CubicO group peptidase (beta-lactamase class C family)